MISPHPDRLDVVELIERSARQLSMPTAKLPKFTVTDDFNKYFEENCRVLMALNEVMRISAIWSAMTPEAQKSLGLDIRVTNWNKFSSAMINRFASHKPRTELVRELTNLRYTGDTDVSAFTEKFRKACAAVESSGVKDLKTFKTVMFTSAFPASVRSNLPSDLYLNGRAPIHRI
ncbi:hypothetical protein SAMD00019534_095380 [Acytostelium subglobosum LB1]|uniref:hypothetical protein n=1 Tax=Acytostelium subglobosum LB1 TaxID=1410327 RepID=UPI0006448B92|nr:hypothetical protein SAMD00019534_095380 [Acytostelium subglobosum LB1]GAM26363.1 hypothetical protein SAMD00019534_095380 [Acytostelium subglobosum LB1]|eukprot:XP_012750917.1 hypothetical protein SAMD00019534_095380 [Acytostelium subglobosum LB1]